MPPVQRQPGAIASNLPSILDSSGMSNGGIYLGAAVGDLQAGIAFGNWSLDPGFLERASVVLTDLPHIRQPMDPRTNLQSVLCGIRRK